MHFDEQIDAGIVVKAIGEPCISILSLSDLNVFLDLK
jgi:hypothetical protein